MATYAPLFAHVEGWRWRPDMIWYDNNNSVRTASYYVQQLFSENKGTNVVPLTMDKKNVTVPKARTACLQALSTTRIATNI